jgi:hypothetical protein
MIITKTNNYTYIIDLPPAIKALYTSTSVQLNKVELSQTLPYTVTLPTGISEVKITLKSANGSYEEKACFLYDDNLQCNLATHLAALDKEKLTNTQLPYLYYMLKEGTTDINDCGCYCDYLLKIYEDINKQINNSDCNC